NGRSSLIRLLAVDVLEVISRRALEEAGLVAGILQAFEFRLGVVEITRPIVGDGRLIQLAHFARRLALLILSQGDLLFRFLAGAIVSELVGRGGFIVLDGVAEALVVQRGFALLEFSAGRFAGVGG